MARGKNSGVSYSSASGAYDGASLENRGPNIALTRSEITRDENWVCAKWSVFDFWTYSSLFLDVVSLVDL